MEQDKELKGLNGWLLLVGFGVLLSPIRILFTSMTTFSDVYKDGVWNLLTNTDSVSYIPYWGSLIILEVTFNVIIFIASLYLVYLFFKERKAFPKIYIFLVLASLFFIVFDTFSASLVISDQKSLDDETVKEFLRVFVGACIWIPYLLKSKRVRNTFINSGSKNEIKVVSFLAGLASITLIIPLVSDNYQQQKTVNTSNAENEYSTNDNINDILVASAKQINKNLPMMVDQETRLDFTMALKHKFLYKYTMVNFKTEELDSNYVYETMKPILVKNVCTNEDMKAFVEYKIPVQYSYYGNDGGKISSVTVLPADCT